MLKKLITHTLVASGLLFSNINAEIIEIGQIETILPSVKQDSFVLFNIANVLTDSEISLGSAPWRAYAKANTTSDLHDKVTWYVANRVQHKPVDPRTPGLIKKLQNKGIAVAALTSRGRNEWYSTQQPGVDKLTRNMLYAMGIDFRQSELPFVSIQMEGAPFLQHFDAGIFYCNHMDKGQFIEELLVNSGYKPSSVILIDDKFDSLADVEAAMQELNIPFTGFWYPCAIVSDKPNFSPMVAHVQLNALIKEDKDLSDEEAQAILDEGYIDIDPACFFNELVEQI